MDIQICLICGRSFHLKNPDAQITIVKNNILFDTCLSLFNIDEKWYNGAYKWKKDCRLDMASFCDLCVEYIEKLAEFEKSAKEMKTKIKDILLKSQILILSSIPVNKRNLYKIDHKLFLPNTFSVFEKIDYFRSVAVKNWLPSVNQKRCDMPEETDGFIHLNPPGLIAIEEVEQYFTDYEGKFHCKLCSKVIKMRKNAVRHINDVHKKMKRFKCKYCRKTFYSKCLNHPCRKRRHVKVTPAKPDSKCTTSNRKCVLCYKSVGDETVEIPSVVLASFISLSCPLHSRQLISNEKLFDDLVVAFTSCVPCSNLFTSLHNLKVEMEHVVTAKNKLHLQLTADLLLSQSKNKVCERTEECNLTPEKLSVAEKMKCFGKLAVKDFCPEVRVFKLKIEPNYDNLQHISGYRPRTRIWRTPTQNSILNLVTDDEIIRLNSDPTVVPLTNEELEYYYKRDGEKFICQLCGGILSSYWDAVSHCNKRHKNIKRFRCKYCSEEFYYRYDCAFHVLSLHKMERADVSAKIEKALTSSSDSITTEDGVINLETKPDLRISTKDYIKMENGSYKCAICLKVYIHRDTVKVHQKKVHLKIYRYKCEFCNYKNHNRHPVLYHVRAMHPEKQKLIDTINNRPTDQLPQFLVKRLRKPKKKRAIDPFLTIGMKILEPKTIHKIEEHFTVIGSNYSCIKCGREFSNRYHILEHIKATHFGIRRYQCGLCNCKYYSHIGCKKHMFKKHPGYLESLQNGETSTLKNSSQPKCVNILEGDKYIPSFPIIVHPEDKDNMEIEEEIHLKTELEHNGDYPDDIIDIGEPFAYKTENNEINVNYDESSNHNNIGISEMEETKNTMIQKHPRIMEILTSKVSSLENPVEVQPFKMNIKDEGNNFPINFNSKFGIDGDTEEEISLRTEFRLNGDSTQDTIDIGKPFDCKTENSELNVNHEESNNQIKIERISNESTESRETLRLDRTEGTQSEKCLLYKFIKAGEIIELPKFPNRAKNGNGGYKKVAEGYKCVKCEKVLKSLKIFYDHWGILHDTSGRYQCSVCQERFYAKFKCAQHYIHKHTDRTPFICEICDATFKSNTSLKQHVQKHMGERPFTCSECPLKFITKDMLNRHHQNVHMKILGS